MCIDGKVTEIVFKCLSIFCGLRMANLKKKLDSSKLNSIHNEDYCFFFSSHKENISAGPNMTMHGYLRKREHSCWKCVRQTQTSGMRREGESNVWFNSPFSLIGRVGNTYPFCAPPLRFRPVHADECPWFDYLTVTGKFREHNRGPIPPPRISHHLCNTKKENQKGMIFTKIFNLANIVGNWNLL